MPSGGQQVAIRWPSGGHQVAIRLPSGGHQVAIRWPSDFQPLLQRPTADEVKSYGNLMEPVVVSITVVAVITIIIAIISITTPILSSTPDPSSYQHHHHHRYNHHHHHHHHQIYVSSLAQMARFTGRSPGGWVDGGACAAGTRCNAGL